MTGPSTTLTAFSLADPEVPEDQLLVNQFGDEVKRNLEKEGLASHKERRGFGLPQALGFKVEDKKLCVLDAKARAASIKEKHGPPKGLCKSLRENGQCQIKNCQASHDVNAYIAWQLHERRCSDQAAAANGSAASPSPKNKAKSKGKGRGKGRGRGPQPVGSAARAEASRSAARVKAAASAPVPARPENASASNQALAQGARSRSRTLAQQR